MGLAVKRAGEELEGVWPTEPPSFLEPFDPLDRWVARKLVPEREESQMLAVAYLCAASRQGHMCVQVEEEALHPSPELLGLELHGRERQLLQGWEELEVKEVVREGNRYYLLRLWEAEKHFLSHLERLCSQPPQISVEGGWLEKKVGAMVESQQLLPEQAQGVLHAAASSVSLIVGGPGTGKTYTAGHLVRLLMEGSGRALRMGLAAPTGKAAAQLQKSLGKSGGQGVQAKTLHALLQEGEGALPLAVDVMLVDESSMIDGEMMGQLLARIPSGARLIFLGDPDQLPPVESGAYFGELAKMKGLTCRLKTCVRVELKTLIEFAQGVNQGDWKGSEKRLKEKGESGLTWKEVDWESQGKELMEELIAACSQRVSGDCDPKSLLKMYGSFRLLTPLRKGKWGTDFLNRQLADWGKGAGERFAPEPILIRKNDHRLQLFNGESGVVMGSQAYFFDQSGELFQLPRVLLPPYDYGYCLSVHKSQGSEFDKVILLLPPGSEVFGREVLYTAVTRAKKELEIWSDAPTLKRTLWRKSERVSGVRAS